MAAEEVESSRRTEGRLLFDEGLFDLSWKSARPLPSLNWFVESLLAESESSSSPHRILRLTAWTFFFLVKQECSKTTICVLNGQIPAWKRLTSPRCLRPTRPTSDVCKRKSNGSSSAWQNHNRQRVFCLFRLVIVLPSVGDASQCAEDCETRPHELKARLKEVGMTPLNGAI